MFGSAMRSLSTVRSILQAVSLQAVGLCSVGLCSFGLCSFGLCSVAALGCGSSEEGPRTVTPAAGEGSGGAIEMEAGELTPAGQGEGNAPGPAPGLVGLVDDEGIEAQTCVDQFVGVTERPPVIQFVVDTSGSMNWVAGTERLPDDGERSKWEITREALATAIANMPDAAAVGVSYYPNIAGGGLQCHRPLAVAPIARLTPEHRALIERANADQVAQGGTPTHAAYEFGVEQLAAST